VGNPQKSYPGSPARAGSFSGFFKNFISWEGFVFERPFVVRNFISFHVSRRIYFYAKIFFASVKDNSFIFYFISRFLAVFFNLQEPYILKIL